MHLVHSEILPMASVAAARLGLVDVTTVDCCSGEFRDGQDASAPPRRMSSRLNLLFEPCYCLTQHVMRSCHKCMRTRKSHGKYCMIRSSF